MTAPIAIPLEDELGDVLEKAMGRTGMTADELAGHCGVPAGKIREAVDYFPGMDCGELRRIAAALSLNEVGLCALGTGHYPLPEIGPLPYCLWPLRMPHGIGVANAYVVAEREATCGLLFDTGGGIGELEAAWPETIRRLDAVFLTHVEGEHAGGLCEVVARFGLPAAFIPMGAKAPCGRPIGEGEERSYGPLTVTAFTTPGHSAAHNCYLVRAQGKPGTSLLISGDLIFAGSVGGGYFSHRQLQTHLRRILEAVPADTIIAPGHGPMTTAENELRYNPFVL